MFAVFGVELLEGVLFVGGRGDVFCANIREVNPRKSKRRTIDFFIFSLLVINSRCGFVLPVKYKFFLKLIVIFSSLSVQNYLPVD